MNSNILIVAAAGIGILAGAGGTYLIMPEPEPIVRVPTEEEAQTAYPARPYSRTPLSTGRGEVDVTLTLGECDENAGGPDVSCVVAIKKNPNSAPLDPVIGSDHLLKP